VWFERFQRLYHQGIYGGGGCFDFVVCHDGGYSGLCGVCIGGGDVGLNDWVGGGGGGGRCV